MPGISQQHGAQHVLFVDCKSLGYTHSPPCGAVVFVTTPILEGKKGSHVGTEPKGGSVKHRNTHQQRPMLTAEARKIVTASSKGKFQVGCVLVRQQQQQRIGRHSAVTINGKQKHFRHSQVCYRRRP